VSREIDDLKQTETFLLRHGLNTLPIMPLLPSYRQTIKWIARVWWRVKGTARVPRGGEQDVIERCPDCKANLQGAEIPMAYRKYHRAGTTHYTNLLGVYDREKDCTVAWRCPHCFVEAASRMYFQVREGESK
jgi:hypothetical protein